MIIKIYFAKILRGEIPNDTVFENEHALAFRDINPQRPHHVLIIPKGKYVSFDHFSKEASNERNNWIYTIYRKSV